MLWGAAGAATGIGLLLVTLDRPADRAIAQAQAEVDEARNKDWYIQVVHFTTEEAARAIRDSGMLRPGSSGVIYVTMPQFVSGMRREEIADRLGIPFNKTEHYFLFYIRASEVDGLVVPAAPFGDSKGGYPELHITKPIALWKDPRRFTQEGVLLIGATFEPPLLPPPIW